MNWPWRTIARQREHLLGLRINDLEKQLAASREETNYFRGRYDRLADLTLVRQVNPNAVAAVHVEPKESTGASLGSRVGRVAQVVGNPRGIEFQKIHHASVAEIPTLER